MKQTLLLTTVFKPFGVDDLYGRKENIPELLSSQVTRVQGIFSPRIWIGNAGLHLIAANCGIHTTVMEWPSLDEFTAELKKTTYDFVGINFIPATLKKMIAMATVVREVSPHSKIIIGGFGTVVPDIRQLVDVDYICEGEGIRYVRHVTGKSPEFTFRHPLVTSKVVEFLGLPIVNHSAALVATGLGCSNGCDFCITSHYFKCSYHPFLNSGVDLYNLVREQAISANVVDFWIMDENFLGNHDRAREFHGAIAGDTNGAPYFNLDLVFSSLENIARFDPQQLAEMGIVTVWLGYESKYSLYAKNRSHDIVATIKSLAEYGITTLLSGILFFDFHTPENIDDDFESFIGCGQAYSQIMPLCSFPPTPLYNKLHAENRIVQSLPWEDRHMLNGGFHSHPHFPVYKQKEIILSAFKKEYLRNGPSVHRILDIRLDGLMKFRQSSSEVLRKRSQRLASVLERDIVWLVATRDIVMEEHRNLVDELIVKMKAVFGGAVVDKYATPISFVSRKVRNVVDEIGRDNMRLLQPETRVTSYPV